MTKLDLCSLKPVFALRNGLYICRHWFCVTLLANPDFYLCLLNFINCLFGSLFWQRRVPTGSLFHNKLGPYC